MTMNDYQSCRLCPLECGVDRTVGKLGRCRSGSEMRVARIAPHYWEEPCLSGQGIEAPVKGSGTVFFTGCSLRCVYCQNQKISRPSGDIGRAYSPRELARELLILQEAGVHNINLVTATHFIPSVIKTLDIARETGLTLPVVYNCSGYESVSSLKMLDGYVDVYLPDFKYFSDRSAEMYSSVSNYREICLAAIREMRSQTGSPLFSDDGFMLKGTVIRHLILPGNDLESRKIVSLLHDKFGSDGVGLSLMSQYTPVCETPYPELNDTLPRAAYIRVVEHAQKLGFKLLYTQDGKSASESFIPEFQ
ncbi:MAG: radical SAM protein [Clostridia bacterium]|nr:radical SAM protein [Clostridia bacterium]